MHTLRSAAVAKIRTDFYATSLQEDYNLPLLARYNVGGIIESAIIAGKYSCQFEIGPDSKIHWRVIIETLIEHGYSVVKSDNTVTVGWGK